MGLRPGDQGGDGRGQGSNQSSRRRVVLLGWFFLRLGFLLEGDERPSVSVSVFQSGCSGCPLSHVLLLRSFPRTRPLLPIPNCPPPIGRSRPMLRRTAPHLIHHPYHIIASSDNHHIAPLAPRSSRSSSPSHLKLDRAHAIVQPPTGLPH
jgi:hypothetical protein